MSFNIFRRASKSHLLRLICITVCMGIIFSGCDSSGGEPVYTVISDGTQGTLTETESISESTAEVSEISDDDIYADVSDTELYIPEHMTAKYSSLNFDKRMSDAYDSTLEALLRFETEIPVPLTISSNIDYWNVLETIRCEQFMLFYVESRAMVQDPVTSALEMTFTYKYSIKETNIMLMETEKAAMDIIAMTDDGMSDYEKVKFFHDYLALNVESDTEDQYADSVYGALVNKKALCEGFAKAFSYLCNIAGIENMIVTGYTSVDHMWNMVKLDGKWYHVDVGWDQPADILRNMYPDMVLYQYFLAEDAVMENNRLISDLMGPPPAVSDDLSYFHYENRYAETYEQALEIIEEACGRCIDSGEKYFMLKLDSSNLYLQTTAGLIKQDENGVSDIDRIVRELNFSGKISYIDYYKAYRIIIFVLE